MLYFDTSFIAPLILAETTSSAVERFVAGVPAGALAVSEWTRVEFASLLSREVRTGSLDNRAARQANAQFETMVAESFVVLLPSADDFNRARHYLGHYQTGLRAGDALHLAIATNNNVEMVCTLDKVMLRAGKILDLPVRGAVSPRRR